MKCEPSNARQISAAHSFYFLRFVFFQELSQSEWAAYEELVRQAKEVENHAAKPINTNLKI